MPRVLIIGASKGIGLETTKQALKAGYDVRAFSRSADRINISNSKLEKIRGDALLSQDIETALDGVDVVIQSVGVGFSDLIRPVHLFSNATRILIAAMAVKDVKRLVSITGFGAGESKKSIHCLQRVPFKLVFGHAYQDKTLQEQLIKESSLDWTIVRPGVLSPGLLTKNYKILETPLEWRNGIISRRSVAHFLVRQIEDRVFIHKDLVLIN